MNMIEAVYQGKIDCFNYQSVWTERLKEIKGACKLFCVSSIFINDLLIDHRTES